MLFFHFCFIEKIFYDYFILLLRKVSCVLACATIGAMRIPSRFASPSADDSLTRQHFLHENAVFFDEIPFKHFPLLFAESFHKIKMTQGETNPLALNEIYSPKSSVKETWSTRFLISSVRPWLKKLVDKYLYTLSFLIFKREWTIPCDSPFCCYWLISPIIIASAPSYQHIPEFRFS